MTTENSKSGERSGHAGTDDKFPAELNALALLLCAPSALNRAWTSCSDDELGGVIRKQLDAHGFSSHVREKAEKAMNDLSGSRQQFQLVASLLRLKLWADVQLPHPEPQTAQRIIELLKDLPDE